MNKYKLIIRRLYVRQSKKAGKFTGSVITIFIFAILFAFNIQVAFSDKAAGEFEFLGMKFSLLSDIYAKYPMADDDDSGGGSGGSSVENRCQTTPPCQKTVVTTSYSYNLFGQLVVTVTIETRYGNSYSCVGTCMNRSCYVGHCDA